jgi:Ca2+-binding EF-hand superfamily protein
MKFYNSPFLLTLFSVAGIGVFLFAQGRDQNRSHGDRAHDDRPHGPAHCEMCERPLPPPHREGDRYSPHREHGGPAGRGRGAVDCNCPHCTHHAAGRPFAGRGPGHDRALPPPRRPAAQHRCPECGRGAPPGRPERGVARGHHGPPPHHGHFGPPPHMGPPPHHGHHGPPPHDGHQGPPPHMGQQLHRGHQGPPHGAMFGVLDSNHDGKITKDELLAVHKKLDSNSDGAVSLEEIREHHGKMAAEGKPGRDSEDHPRGRAHSDAAAPGEHRGEKHDQPGHRPGPPHDPRMEHRPMGPHPMGPPMGHPPGPPMGRHPMGPPPHDRLSDHPGSPPMGPPSPELLFKHFDKNKDSNLTKDEIPFWERLSQADANKDGNVNKEELGKFMKERGKGTPEAGGDRKPEKHEAESKERKAKEAPSKENPKPEKEMSSATEADYFTTEVEAVGTEADFFTVNSPVNAPVSAVEIQFVDVETAIAVPVLEGTILDGSVEFSISNELPDMQLLFEAVQHE